MEISQKSDQEIIRILTLSDDYRSEVVDAAIQEFGRRGMRKKAFRGAAKELMQAHISDLYKGFSPFKSDPEPPSSWFFSRKELQSMMRKERKSVLGKRKDFRSGMDPGLLS